MSADGTVVATSTTEAEYVAAASCCGQVLWIQNQLLDYGYNFMNTVINIDNNSTICIIENPVQHSKTKHIEIRHHFIRDCNAKKLIQMVKIHTDHNVVDLLTKGFDAGRFQYLVSILFEGRLLMSICSQAWMKGHVGDEVVHKELGDRMERAATTASSLEAEQDNEQFWQTTALSTNEDGVRGITATIDRKVKVFVSEASIKFKVKEHHRPSCVPTHTLLTQYPGQASGTFIRTSARLHDAPLSELTLLKWQSSITHKELMDLVLALTAKSGASQAKKDLATKISPNRGGIMQIKILEHHLPSLTQVDTSAAEMEFMTPTKDGTSETTKKTSPTTLEAQSISSVVEAQDFTCLVTTTGRVQVTTYSGFAKAKSQEKTSAQACIALYTRILRETLLLELASNQDLVIRNFTQGTIDPQAVDFARKMVEMVPMKEARNLLRKIQLKITSQLPKTEQNNNSSTSLKVIGKECKNLVPIGLKKPVRKEKKRKLEASQAQQEEQLEKQKTFNDTEPRLTEVNTGKLANNCEIENVEQIKVARNVKKKDYLDIKHGDKYELEVLFNGALGGKIIIVPLASLETKTGPLPLRITSQAALSVASREAKVVLYHHELTIHHLRHEECLQAYLLAYQLPLLGLLKIRI
ncbi:hypothetical protein Tco_0455906 [Tanacetum coccineum]